jgi:hypothetical protein
VPQRRKRVALLSVGVLAAAGLSLAVGTSTSSAASVTGTMVTQNLTRAGGGAWLPGGGGNFWVSDNVLGLCETVPASLSTTKCNGTAKGGQVVWDAGKNVVYQADTTTKTNQVMRFPYTASNDSLGGSPGLTVRSVSTSGS